MDDLITWLREQIDEDERAASGMPADWSAYIEGGTDGFAVEDCDGDWAAIIGPERQAHHIALHDPARVLREVKAKRATVELHHHEQLGLSNDPDDLGCRVCAESYIDGGLQPLGYCETIRLLASVYSDRPGYRPEWAV